MLFVLVACQTRGACIGHRTADYSAMEATGSASKWRWPECCHLFMPSPWPAVCAGPSRVQHACVCSQDKILLLMLLLQDWLTLPVYTCVWFSEAWGSATFWWQSYACNCSVFCMCIRSGSPHNIVHFLVKLWSMCITSTTLAVHA